LIAAPLAERDTEIDVFNIQEFPYIEMTLQWLNEQGVKYEKNDNLTRFRVKGNQTYRAFEKTVPGDWSSGTFPLVAAAITKSDVLLKGLDINDVQGDKAVVGYLKKMGAVIITEKLGLRIKGKPLQGREIDLNATPDALPALAVLGCFADGTTRLYNVAQARIKETDRIKVMAEELSKMAGRIEEMADGLIIHHSKLKGARVEGYFDHRVIMALVLAGLIAEGTTEISTAEAVDVTFPEFVGLMKSLGAKIDVK
jgi:3-phosphoshikimate 1-carboxyvinyltransferase